MSFESCMIGLKLNGKLPAGELRADAAPYEAQGLTPEAALLRAVKDKLDMALMEERQIVAAVRSAWEAKGGKPKAVKEAKAEKPADIAGPDTMASKIAAPLETGKPVTLYYSRNTEAARPNARAFGDVGIDIEPAGEYMNVEQSTELKAPTDKWEAGAVRFANPLVLEHKNTTSTGWKKDLSDMFGGKTGKALTAAIKKAGHDAIITYDNYGLNETVNLSGQKFASMEEAKAAPEAPAKQTQLKDLQRDAVKAAVAYEKYDAKVREDAKRGIEPDGDEYFAASGEANDSEARFADALAALPDAGFALQATTPDGRMLMLNASAQKPGAWQLTRFAKDGSPWGDTQYPTKKQAVAVFLNESDLNTVRDFDGKLDAPAKPNLLTDNPAFARWFKGSKVVDAEGNPMVMYHGTSSGGFSMFDTYASNYGLMGMGGYFTADPAVASSYTTKGKGDAPTVYPVHLSIKNPIDMDGKADADRWRAQFEGIEEFHEGGDTNESWYRAAEDMLADQGLPKWEGAEAMQDGLRNMGFDGITHIGGGRIKSDSVRHRVYVAFDPEQVKSATGNSGAYDPADPNIMASLTGDLGMDSALLDHMEAIADERGMVKADELMRWVRVQGSPGAASLANWLDAMGDAQVSESSVVKFMESSGNAMFAQADAPQDSTRRRLLVAAAAAAISPANAGDVKVGKAQPISPAVLAQRVDKGVEKILRHGQEGGTTSLNGGRALKQAMKAISLTGPKELRALAATIAKLLPDTGTIMLTVDDRRRMNVHGVVELAPFVHLTLFTAEGRTGLSYETVLHEALHIAVAARYRSLSVGMIRGNDAVMGMSAPQAAEALKQFEQVWEEFRTATAGEKFGNRQLELAVSEARGNPDEFFVRTLTDPVLQAYMAGKEYKGKTLWARFKDWVQSSLFGFKQAGTAPSWLDAALAATGDVSQAMGADRADFKRMAAISRVQASRNNARATPKGDQGARDLVITHNLTEANLIHAVKMGGIAVPSLAVTKKDSPLSGFGEITLIGSRSMADPKGYAGTKVFGADIYSPRYPSVEHEIDQRAHAAFVKKFNPMADSMGIYLPDRDDLERKGVEAVERNLSVMAQFIQDQGAEPAIVMKAPSMDAARLARLKKFGLDEYLNVTQSWQLMDDPEFVKRAAAEVIDSYRSVEDETGRMQKMAAKLEADPDAQRNLARDLAHRIANDAQARKKPEADKYATQTALEKQIEDAGLSEQFQRYAADEMAALSKSERIFKGFSNSGKRTYTPHTLENVVKILKKELRGGENFNYGVGSLRAKFTPQFKSIAQIQKERDRLVTAEQFEEIKKEIDAEFFAVRRAFELGTERGNLETETAIAILEDAPRMGLDRAAKEYGVELDDQSRQMAAEFLTRLHHLPTAYFEAKILREVDLAEFAGAVIPAKASQKVRDLLTARGVRFTEYESEADRAAAIDRFAQELDEADGDVLFSKMPPGPPPQAQMNLFPRTPAPTWDMPDMDRLDTVIHVLQDKHIDMRRAVQEVRKQIANLDDKWDPYLQEELFHGRAATGFKSFLHDELRPLLTDMQARGVAMEEFEEYLHMRHAQEANEQVASVNPEMPDEGSGVKTADAQDYLANLPPAKQRAYEALAARVDAINAGTQRLLVDYGLEKQSTIDTWNATYDHYVPLMREDMDHAGGTGTGQGFSVRGPASKRRMGSKRAVIDIIANVAMARERAVVRGEKNRLDVALYGMALQAPNPEFWKPVNPQKNPDALRNELLNMGLSPMLVAAIIDEPKQRVIDKQTGLVVRRTNPVLRSAPNVVAVRINGEDRYVFFNERDERAMRMATTLKNLGSDGLNRFLMTAGIATRYFASVNTQYNPIFGIVNLVRDLGEGALNLTSTPLAGRQGEVVAEATRLLGITAVKGFRLENLTGADAALWEEFQKEGGITGFRAMFANSDDRAKELRSELAKMTANPLSKVGHAVFDWLSDYNEALENVTRMAAYKVAKHHGMSNQQAASLAKSLTVNFNRKGAIGAQVGSLYAFFNAASQGIARMAQTLNGPAGKKIVAGGLLLGTMQALMMAAAGYDDEEPPEFIKGRNLVIPLGWATGKKDFLTVPYPLGFSFIPTVGRLATEYAIRGFKKPGHYLTEMAGALLDTFNPIGNAGFSLQTIAPTVIDPLAALERNRDWTGKPIYREDMSGLKPTPGHTRAKDTASAVAKTTSRAFNWLSGGTEYMPGRFSPTPDQIDYLIGQITGGVGREYLKAEQTAIGVFTGEEVPAHKIPLAGRFYGNADGKGSVSATFYDNLKELNRLSQEVEGRRKDRGDYKSFLDEHPEAKLADEAAAVYRDISAKRKYKREQVEKGADRIKIKDIDLGITNTMLKFNDKVKAARKREASAEVD